MGGGSPRAKMLIGCGTRQPRNPGTAMALVSRATFNLINGPSYEERGVYGGSP